LKSLSISDIDQMPAKTSATRVQVKTIARGKQAGSGIVPERAEKAHAGPLSSVFDSNAIDRRVIAWSAGPTIPSGDLV
jgi:hypothetical protein